MSAETRAAEIVRRIRVRAGLDASAAVGVRAAPARIVAAKSTARERLVTLIATTDRVDVDHEVVIPGGGEGGYFFENRRVFLDHRLDTEYAVASLRWAKRYPGDRDAREWRIQVAMHSTPIAQDVYTMLTEHGLSASIGFLALDRGAPTAAEKAAYPGAERIVRRWEWIETSFTAFPANVSCRVIAVEDGAMLAQLDELARKSVIRPETAYALGLPRTAPPRLRRVVVRQRG